MNLLKILELRQWQPAGILLVVVSMLIIAALLVVYHPMGSKGKGVVDSAGCAVFLALACISTLLFIRSKSLEKEVNAKSAALDRSDQRLHAVLDGLNAGVYVADTATHEIVYMNKYLQNIFGDAVGNVCWKIFHQHRSAPCELCTNEQLPPPEESITPGHIRVSHNPGNGKWYEIHNRSVCWLNGCIGRLGLVRDITDRKLTEGELERTQLRIKTFCHIMGSIGAQRNLDDLGSLLIRGLQNLVRGSRAQLYFFSSDRRSLFILTDQGTRIMQDSELVQAALKIFESSSGSAVAPGYTSDSSRALEIFPKGRTTIVPLREYNRIIGASVLAGAAECLHQRDDLEMVALILEQASGSIRRALSHEEELRSLQSRLDNSSGFCGMIGKDPKMHFIYKLIDDVASTDSTVLIQGESGTGKELVARAIHHQSPRRNKPMVVINCAAYPATLLESELFGHERGAFTGAIRTKPGCFEQAHGGTVFLDEIGEISPAAQIKLLRVVQTHQIKRLGGEKLLDVDVRIIAATNRDLIQEVKKGNFREDLYYRINVIPVFMPPLRERPNDIPLLVRYFLGRFAAEQGKQVHRISSEALHILLDHAWPGNVRELENTIEHAMVLAKGDQIDVEHLPSPLRNEVRSGITAPGGAILLESERKVLVNVLEECAWNKKQAAKRLGISRSTLYDKLKRYQITPPTIH